MSASLDALSLPLDGIRVVEASAGTGKTFTIATLYLRLILERGLKVDEIVVATFTRAAAAELSIRLRERLVLADELLAAADPTTAPGDEGGARDATRHAIQRVLAAGGTLDDLRDRVRAARFGIDTAIIGTLHGFCHRVLSEFGFETGQALAQPELIEDIRELEIEIVRDFWRRGSVDAATADLLTEVWGSPEKLVQQVCDPRWRGRTIKVSEPDFDDLRHKFEIARRAVAGWNASVTGAFARELARCVDTARTRSGRTEALRQTLDWARSGTPDEARAAFDAKRTASLLAAAIEELKPKGVRPEGQPFADLAALSEAHARLQQANDVLERLPAARLLRDARAGLDAELPKRLAERNLMSHDQAVDRLAEALADGERGRRAAARIRGRWKAALVDEFQDTDPRQWQVVRTVFGGSTLVLVGDPKQAIYGFRGGDVFAWMQARDQASDFGDPLRLTESFRAGESLCRATNALFSVPGAFIEPIGHPDIHAAAPVRQCALLRDGEVLPALEVWRLDPERIRHEPGKPPSKARVRAVIERACVAWITNALGDDTIRLRDGRGEPHALCPKHIAVLVNTNTEAHSLQAALSRAGVAASCNLRASVYASEEAADLALLLDALAAPDDARRVRAARASLLVGDDATVLAASVDNDAQTATWLEDAAGWAAEVRRRGPLAWLHRLLARVAQDLLATPAGERRVANYLQLAELLQELHAASFGIEDLATRFARARVEAEDDADGARLRLDTDADAVTIATVHAAKGLGYPVVLVPYAVMGRDPDRPQGGLPVLHWYHDDAALARVAIGGVAAEPEIRARDEVRAEGVRRLYVAVTRASAFCALPWGPVSQMRHTAAFHLLHAAGHDPKLPDDAAGCEAAVQALCERAGGAARMVELPRVLRQAAPVGKSDAGKLRAREFSRRRIERDWQVWSFSRLVRGSPNEAGPDPRPGTGDADGVPASLEPVESPGPGGAPFGTAVHAVFEQADFAAWRGADSIPAGEGALVERSLRDVGLAGGGAAARRAIEVAGACVRDALNATLPCGLRLCDVEPAQRRAEIEFHLSLSPAKASDWLALLHAHGYQRERQAIASERLHGLMTGKIDLTFHHAGRFHIIDWKTNRCPPYDEAAMRAEFAVHDYDLQWLVYTLALHRWLRQRLPDYDYDRDVGEVYYLFVRGMAEGGGIHVDRPPRGLVEAMDALFDARMEVAA